VNVHAEVSDSPTYSFPATGDRTLRAIGLEEPPTEEPETPEPIEQNEHHDTAKQQLADGNVCFRSLWFFHLASSTVSTPVCKAFRVIACFYHVLLYFYFVENLHLLIFSKGTN
jgi:hypothetical protein